MLSSIFTAIEKRANWVDPQAAAFRALSTLPKTASADDLSTETDEEGRARRVGEFLRRRSPSGLLNGSASPTPPKDTSP